MNGRPDAAYVMPDAGCACTSEIATGHRPLNRKHFGLCTRFPERRFRPVSSSWVWPQSAGFSLENLPIRFNFVRVTITFPDHAPLPSGSAPSKTRNQIERASVWVALARQEIVMVGVIADGS